MITLRNIMLNFFSHQTLALIRWDFHFLWIRVSNVLFKKERTLNKILDTKNSPLYLNLGSGPRGLTDSRWLNVDGYKDNNVHFCLDLTKSLPLPNNRFEGIFCEHVLEHFTMDKGRQLLSECFRILAPGGCIRLIVPDGEKIMRTYFENPGELVKRRQSVTSCDMEAVNSYFRQRYEHQIAYDEKLLAWQLQAVGFIEVERMCFGRAKASTSILIDDEKYAWESLYIEAIKPEV